MTNNYATVEDMEQQSDLNMADDDNLANAQNFLDSAAFMIDKICGRPDGFLALVTPTERTLSGNGQGYMRIPENTGVTIVKVKASRDDTTYVTWDASDYLTFSGDIRTPNFERKPYDHIMISGDGDQTEFTNGIYYKYGIFQGKQYRIPVHVPTVKITAKWGYADSVPAPVKTCTILQAMRWFKRAQAQWADDVGNLDFGTLAFTKEIDHDIKMMLYHGKMIKPSL